MADLKHGTEYAYSKRSCRCDECKAANAEWHRAYRARRAARNDSYVRKDRPAETQHRRVPCTSCGRIIARTSLPQPICTPCRYRAKRGIHIAAKLRLAIYERDGWVCGFCFEPVDQRLSGTDQDGPTLDHIVPRSKGGSDDETNLRLLHRHCNVTRSNRSVLTLADLS